MDQVRRVPVEVDTAAPGGRTGAYLLGTGETLLVDPAARTAELDAVVDEQSVDHIAVTHSHSDHVGAVAAYAERSEATVWARRGRAEQFTTATGIEPDRTFLEGTQIGPATTVSTPGHTADHTAFSITEETGQSGTETLVTGDLVVADGSVVVGAPDGDMRAYVTSLRRLFARDPDRLYPAHGPVIDTPKETILRLLEHRLDRERRVRAAVHNGAKDLSAILEAAYDKSLEGVEELALATVRAHLQKLAVEAETVDERERYRALTSSAPSTSGY